MPGRQDTNPRRMPIRFGTATAQTAARIGRLESGSMRVAADFGVDQLFGVARLAATPGPSPRRSRRSEECQSKPGAEIREMLVEWTPDQSSPKGPLDIWVAERHQPPDAERQSEQPAAAAGE
jgi:hypothetical protein